MSTTEWIPFAVVLSGASIGAVTDVWKFRVYNALTFPLFLSGLLYHSFASGTAGLFESLGGATGGFLLLLVPYVLGLMGAGDVKLLASVGAWLGFPVTLLVFVVSSLVTGVYALLLIVMRGRILESWATIKVIFYRLAVLGSAFGKDDLVEPLMAGNDRRLRVIPFGAMVPLGIVGAIYWMRYH